MTNVLIVEDERLTGEMLAQYVRSAPDRYSLAKLIQNAADAPLVCSRTKIDLILMDVCTEGSSSGLDAAGKIKERFPNIKVIIVTSAPEYRFIEKARAAGAESFWYKNTTETELLTVMDRTMEGESVYPDSTPLIRMGDTDNHHFTGRELETLYWLVKVGTAKEIAKEMHCSPRTVESNLQSLYNKTGCSTKTELAILAVENRIVLPKY